MAYPNGWKKLLRGLIATASIGVNALNSLSLRDMIVFRAGK
jgi:hypothetical protein